MFLFGVILLDLISCVDSPNVLYFILSKTAVHSLSHSRRKDYQNQFDAFQALMGREERDGLIFP